MTLLTLQRANGGFWSDSELEWKKTCHFGWRSCTKPETRRVSRIKSSSRYTPTCKSLTRPRMLKSSGELNRVCPCKPSALIIFSRNVFHGELVFIPLAHSEGTPCWTALT